MPENHPRVKQGRKTGTRTAIRSILLSIAVIISLLVTPLLLPSPLKANHTTNEYFASVQSTGHDRGDPDTLNDYVRLRMNADSESSGYVYARGCLFSPTGSLIECRTSGQWYIRYNSIEYRNLQLYVPGGQPVGPYSITLSLYDRYGNLEDAWSGRIQLYPYNYAEVRPLLPDLIVDTNAMGDWFVEENFIRFSTATANIGEGPLELRGGTPSNDGTRPVYQRIYNSDGSYTDVLAGRFTYDSHPHLHFDEYALFNLRTLTADGGVGNLVVAGNKVSFCLVDSQPYLEGAGSRRYPDCYETSQGISVGWKDIYSYDLECQYADLSGVPAGEYWLEVVSDYSGRLRELNESNNLARIRVSVPTTVPQNDAGGRKDAGCGYGSAVSVVANTTYSGEIRGGADDAGDWYSFNVQSGQAINATLTPPAGADFDLMIYDPTRREVARSSLGTGRTEQLSVMTGVGGTWGVNIVWASGGGSYSFRIDLSSTQGSENDAGSGSDAGNSFTTATPIAVNTAYSGRIAGGVDTQDWYQFTVSAGQGITVTMSPNPAADFDLELYDPNGAWRASSWLGTGETDTITYTADTAGSWKIRIYQYSGTGHYSFSVTFASSPTSAASGADASSSSTSLPTVERPNSTATRHNKLRS